MNGRRITLAASWRTAPVTSQHLERLTSSSTNAGGEDILMRSWQARIRSLSGQQSVRVAGGGIVAVCLIALTLSSLGVFARPVHRAQLPVSSRPGRHVPLPGTLPRALAHAQRVQREDGTRPLQLAVSLRIQHPTDLEALIASQQDPKSAKYHKYLSPQAFADQFGPAPETVAAVRKFLEDAGLRVTSVSANRLLINASGTAVQAEKAFDITISQYQLDQRTVFAPDQ